MAGYMRPFPKVCEENGVPCPDRKPGCQGSCQKMLDAKAAYELEKAKHAKERQAAIDVEYVKRTCIVRIAKTRHRRKSREG